MLAVLALERQQDVALIVAVVCAVRSRLTPEAGQFATIRYGCGREDQLVLHIARTTAGAASAGTSSRRTRTGSSKSG